MSNRNEDRTLSGSTEIYADILDLPSTINAIRIKNNFGLAGQVLCKNTTNNKLEFNSVPIADDTITTNMIQNLAITDAKIANNTITGGKLSANVNGTFNIDTSGGIEANNLQADNDLVVNGNTNLNGTLTTIGNANSDSLLTRGTILFFNGASAVGTFASNTGTLTIPNLVAPTSLSVGSQAELVVDGGAHTATFGASTIFGGEMSMATGGSEVFDMNDHNITDCGGLAFTTGSDITNCDTITANTLNLNTALSMTNLNLDLGSGDLTCDNATFDGGAVLIDGTGIVCKVAGGGTTTITMNHTNGVISCKGLGTAGGNITTVNGTIDTGSGNITTTGRITATESDISQIHGQPILIDKFLIGNGSIRSSNGGEILGYAGLGDPNLDINLLDGSISCKAINTQNSNLTMGSGDITCQFITSNAINTSNSNITMGTGGITGATGTITTFNSTTNNTTTINSTTLHTGAITVSNKTTGIGSSGLSSGESIPLRQFNLYNIDNDIPRIIGAKSFFADHDYSRTITTSYKNIDKDTTTLNIAFNVPPSKKVVVEVGFYIKNTLNNKPLLMRLVNSAGAEFYATYINNSNHGHSTESMEIAQDGRGSTIITKWWLSFPTIGSLVNLQPQCKVNSGTCVISTGGTYTGQTPPMYVKIESLGSNSAFNWHYETASGGDDY